MAEIQGDSPEAVAYELFRVLPGTKAATVDEYLAAFAKCLRAVRNPEQFSSPE